jgi:hypothetical protein
MRLAAASVRDGQTNSDRGAQRLRMGLLAALPNRDVRCVRDVNDVDSRVVTEVVRAGAPAWRSAASSDDQTDRAGTVAGARGGRGLRRGLRDRTPGSRSESAALNSAFADSVAPHAQRFGLRRGDGLGLLRWLLELVGDPNTGLWITEARAHHERVTDVERPPSPRWAEGLMDACDQRWAVA